MDGVQLHSRRLVLLLDSGNEALGRLVRNIHDMGATVDRRN